MSNHKFTENSYEQALISLFRDELGYEYIYGPDIERDLHAGIAVIARVEHGIALLNDQRS